MIDYKKMYLLLKEAASDSINILSHELDDETINSTIFLLQQALVRANGVYDRTASGDYPAEEQI